jgi:hypothetical protein
MRICPECKSVIEMKTEQTICECNPSMWKYWWLLLPAICTGPFFFIFWWIANACRKNIIYKITTRRIIIERGTFSYWYEEISVADIRAINLKQNFFQGLADCGSIRVVSAASLGAGYEIMNWVKQPEKVREILSGLKLSKEFGDLKPAEIRE